MSRGQDAAWVESCSCVPPPLYFCAHSLLHHCERCTQCSPGCCQNLKRMHCRVQLFHAVTKLTSKCLPFLFCSSPKRYQYLLSNPPFLVRQCSHQCCIAPPCLLILLVHRSSPGFVTCVRFRVLLTASFYQHAGNRFPYHLTVNFSREPFMMMIF